IRVETFNSNLLFEPWTIRSKSKQGPLQVFTAFWNECLKQPAPTAPQAAPTEWKSPKRWPESLKLDDLELEPRIDWAKGLRASWNPGERGAEENLKTFLGERVEEYSTRRNFPDEAGTSRLSPHLHFGEISPRKIWHVIEKK